MTFEDLIDLQKYIQNKVGYQVTLGAEDVPGNSYPIIQINLDGDFNIVAMNERSDTVNDEIDIKIIVEKNNDLEAFRIRDKLIEQLGTFKTEKGMNFIPDEGTREYTEATFQITISFLFKNIIQNIL